MIAGTWASLLVSGTVWEHYLVIVLLPVGLAWPGATWFERLVESRALGMDVNPTARVVVQALLAGGARCEARRALEATFEGIDPATIDRELDGFAASLRASRLLEPLLPAGF